MNKLHSRQNNLWGPIFWEKNGVHILADANNYMDCGKLTAAMEQVSDAEPLKQKVVALLEIFCRIKVDDTLTKVSTDEPLIKQVLKLIKLLEERGILTAAQFVGSYAHLVRLDSPVVRGEGRSVAVSKKYWT